MNRKDVIKYSNSEFKGKLKNYMYNYYNKLEEQNNQIDDTER